MNLFGGELPQAGYNTFRSQQYFIRFGFWDSDKCCPQSQENDCESKRSNSEELDTRRELIVSSKSSVGPELNLSHSLFLLSLQVQN